MMKIMYVYIIECSDGTYYAGVTNNLERRIIEHTAGINKNCYTYSRRPLSLVFHEQYNNPVLAISLEKKIKNWSKAKKKALIEGNIELLPELSKKIFRAK